MTDQHSLHCVHSVVVLSVNCVFSVFCGTLFYFRISVFRLICIIIYTITLIIPSVVLSCCVKHRIHQRQYNKNDSGLNLFKKKFPEFAECFVNLNVFTRKFLPYVSKMSWHGC